MEPIFIIGTERSGTNLLRIILNSHSSITIPHPPHILKNFFALEHLYSDLKNDSNFKNLIHDVVATVELHPHPWGVKIDQDKIFHAIAERNLINIFFSVYDQYRESTGKKRWGCKSTFMINHVALIRQYYPRAQFIYMVRDGRDVAVSAKKSIFNHFNIYYTAKLWKLEQQMGIYWLNKLSQENILLVKYEELLGDTENVIRGICSFLNEPYEDMLGYFKTAEAKKTASISDDWRNTSKPIIRNNHQKYRDNLRKSEIELFEKIAASELNHFSYKTDFYDKSYCETVKFKISYFIEEMCLMMAAQIKHFFSDKNNLLRYKKRLFIKSRPLARLIK